MQETRNETVPLTLARDPDAKHLREDGQKIGDQDDAEAYCNADLGLLL